MSMLTLAVDGDSVGVFGVVSNNVWPFESQSF